MLILCIALDVLLFSKNAKLTMFQSATTPGSSCGIPQGTA